MNQHDQLVLLMAKARINCDGPDSWDLMHPDYRQMEIKYMQAALAVVRREYVIVTKELVQDWLGCIKDINGDNDDMMSTQLYAAMNAADDHGAQGRGDGI